MKNDLKVLAGYSAIIGLRLKIAFDRAVTSKIIPSKKRTRQLTEACERLDAKEVERLLQKGADPDRSSKEWLTDVDTPLKIVISHMQEDEVGAIECVKLLLKNGADPNRGYSPHYEKRDRSTWSGSAISASQNRSALFDLSFIIWNRRTPFQGSVIAEIATLLLEAGANTDVRDCLGKTPVDWASEHVPPNTVFIKAVQGYKEKNKKTFSPPAPGAV